MRKARASIFTYVDLCPSPLSQLTMSRNEIRVEVRLEDVFDLRPPLLRRFQVNLDIPLRINHKGLPLRGNQVRSMRQTAEVKLFEVHGSPYIEEVAVNCSRTHDIVTKKLAVQKKISYGGCESEDLR